MFKKAILIFSPLFQLLNFYWIYDNSLPLDLSFINAAGLAVGTSALVTISLELAIYQKKRNATSKTLSASLIMVLLFFLLSGITFAALSSEDCNLLSPAELQTNFLGRTGYSIFQLADESFILNTANQSCTFLVKLDSSYHEVWSKTIRISQENTVLSRLVPTSDGGYALAGIVNNQYVLIKTGAQGSIQWTRTLNSRAPINYLRAIIQTHDGGFAIAGFGETIEEGLGWIWLAKTDSLGNMEWNKTLSGPVADCPSSIIQTADGGYMMSDVSYSFVPDQGFFRLIRMDAHGNVLWNTTYGGEGYYLKPECNLAISKDGGYFMAGYLWDTNAWVVKTDAEGNMQWNQTYGAKGSSIVGALETQNGSYLLVSISDYYNAGLILADNLGNKLWNITFPDVTLPIGFEANFNSIIQTKNGEYIIIGSKNQTVWLATLNYQNILPTALQSLSIINSALSVVMIMTLLATAKKKDLDATISLSANIKLKNDCKTMHSTII